MRNLKTIGASVAILLLTTSLKATVLYWDPNGTTSVGGSGTWDTTSLQWSTASTQSASPVAWVSGDAAGFCAGPSSGTLQGTFTVTNNSALTIGGIFNGNLNPGPCYVTIVGSGSFTIPSGLQAFATGGTAGGQTTVAIPITGPGILTAESSSQLFLNATNTYTGGTYLGWSGSSFSGIVNFNNARAFGTGPIVVSNSTGALVIEGTTAINVTNALTFINPYSLNIVGNAAGLTLSGPVTLPSAGTVSIGSGGASGNLVNLAGVISGGAGLTKYGLGVLELDASNTFSGVFTINSNTVVAGTNGFFNSANLSMLPNSTLDISANTNFTFSKSVTAAGTNALVSTLIGSTNAPIRLGVASLVLTFNPTSFNGDMTHPALKVTRGVLQFNTNSASNNNLIFVTNSAATKLGVGAYVIATSADGFAGSINPAITVAGTGAATGTSAKVVISGTNLLLEVSQPLTVYASNYTRAYGTTNPAFTVSYSNFVSGQTLATSDVTGAPALTTGATITSLPGTYTITNKVGTLVSTNGTYTFVLVNGTLTITNSPYTNLLTGITTSANGSAQVSFSGIPGDNYAVQSATNLTPPVVWTTITNVTADTNGLCQFTDSNASNYPSQFYRTFLTP